MSDADRAVDLIDVRTELACGSDSASLGDQGWEPLFPPRGNRRSLPPTTYDFTSAWPEPHCPLHPDGYCNCFDEVLF